MTEELHEITYTVRCTRSQIEKIAADDEWGDSNMSAACREWLEANPKRGLTRDEFDALPDGSVVKPANNYEYVKVGDRLACTNSDDYSILFVVLADADLTNMTVVSTPPPPSLEEVDVALDKEGELWEHIGNLWNNRRYGDYTYNTLQQLHGPLTPLIPGPQIGGET